MKKYLNVLLTDLAEAKNNRPTIRASTKDEMLPLELDYFFEENRADTSEKDETKTPKEPPKSGNIREIMGLQVEQFPSAEYWSEEEATQLVTALNDLLEHYNLFADYPSNLPPHLAYTTLVGALEKYAPILPYGEWHLEFCHYDPAECPFGEAYCSCLEIFSSDLEKTDEEHFLDSIEHPDNIPFIHNYCDNWCERCAFSDRCAVSCISTRYNEYSPNVVELSLWQDDSEKWETIQAWFKTQSLLIDPSFIEQLKEERQVFDKDNNQVKRDSDRVAVVQLSKQYVEALKPWMKIEKINRLFEMVDNKEGKKHFTKKERLLMEPLHTIMWYIYLIIAKFTRAVEGKIEDDLYDDTFPKDSDGSAKVALIGAERTLMAWYDFAQIEPTEADFALKMMLLLQKVIDAGEKEFPEARAFVRPGFDENI
jgi:hypothetical protein